MPRASEDELVRWRALDSSTVLQQLADHAKRDVTFNPLKDTHTTRWHASVGPAEFELLLTGSKFFDTRAGAGGGGGIDLAMHLLRVNFQAAARALREKRL